MDSSPNFRRRESEDNEPSPDWQVREDFVPKTNMVFITEEEGFHGNRDHMSRSERDLQKRSRPSNGKCPSAEARETIESQARRKTITNYPLEHQLSRVYTRAVFRKYKEAYVYGTSFLTKKVGTGRFLVPYGRDRPTFSWSQHEFKVVFDEENEEYKCECKQWEHTGLLCPHLIIVMTNEQIQRLPSNGRHFNMLREAYAVLKELKVAVTQLPAS
ncbi:hypothetical protein ZWY2020_057707 [Hordeum vulgare]|nr:hypothetical protein ZWY2020_057707 [Hordeum vulgare]